MLFRRPDISSHPLGNYWEGVGLPDFDASPDGQSFFVVTDTDVGPARPQIVTLITNWLDEVRERVPAQR